MTEQVVYTNLHGNPSLNSSQTSHVWAARAVLAFVGGGLKVTVTDTTSGLPYFYGFSPAGVAPSSGRMPVGATGSRVAFRARVTALQDLRLQAAVGAYDGAGGGIGGVTYPPQSSARTTDLREGDSAWVELIADVPNSPAVVSWLPLVYMYAYGSQNPIPLGDAVILERLIAVTRDTGPGSLDTSYPDYFDGDSARFVAQSGESVQHAWAGTPHASVSTQTYIPQQRADFSVRATKREGWRYLAQRLTGEGTSEELLDLDVPLQNVTLTDNLSGPTDITATIAPEVARLQGPDGLPIFAKWQTAIYAEHEGEIRAGAILTDMDRQGAGLSLTCTGFSSYPDGQPWVGPGYIGIKVDPLDVAREIWDHLQAKPYGNLGMTLDRKTKAGFTIGTEYNVATLDPQDDPNVGPSTFESGPVLMRWYDTQDLGEEFVKLSEETPFDYHERHAWVGDEIHHFLDFGYPRIGRRRRDLRFVVGENIAALPQISSDEYATEILALGHGEGRTTKHAVTSRPGKLRRAIMVMDKSAKTQRRVNALAKRELAWRTGADDITSVVLRDHPHAPLGSYSVGDEILVEGNVGWGALDVWARIVSVSIRPEQGDSAELTLIRSDKA